MSSAASTPRTAGPGFCTSPRRRTRALSLLRVIGETTREETLSGFSGADQEHLTKSLMLMKANLVEACSLPVGDKEASHG